MAMAKLLLVEDDISLRDIYSARFEAEGYQVVVASNGEEALAAAVKEKPDLILLDIMMPRISGFDVLDIIRSTPETANTRVIMMTALSDPESRAKGEKLGVNKFLVKSQVTLEDIVGEVKRELAAAPPSAVKTAGEPILGAPETPVGSIGQPMVAATAPTTTVAAAIPVPSPASVAPMPASTPAAATPTDATMTPPPQAPALDPTPPTAPPTS